jgi:hypothetical protein
MLTRHSPLHALGYAEAGWLVGESGGQSRFTDCCTTAQVLHKTDQAQVSHIASENRTESIAYRLVVTNRKKSRDPILGPCHEDRRGSSGHPTAVAQPARSFTGLVGRLQNPDPMPENWWQKYSPSRGKVRFLWSRIL